MNVEMTGSMHRNVRCIPTDRAIEGVDVCGCGDQTCPELREFTSINCPGQDALKEELKDVMMFPHHNHDNNMMESTVDLAIVCRQLYDPFTGEHNLNKTLLVPADHSFEDDVCGCCNDDCPLSEGDMRLPTPDLEFVELNCPQSDECKMRDGESSSGFFVCREMNHPVTGELHSRTFCVPSDSGLEGDTCGCCQSYDDNVDRCPEPPQGGFDDTDGQIVAMALEAYPDEGLGSSTLPSGTFSKDVQTLTYGWIVGGVIFFMV
jgi:hypothetical protein